MVPSQFDFFKFNLVKKINHAWYPLQHASSFVQLLNVQSFLGMMGGLLATPLVVASSLCISGDNVATREVISTSFFVSGIATLMQLTFGTR